MIFKPDEHLVEEDVKLKHKISDETLKGRKRPNVTVTVICSVVGTISFICLFTSLSIASIIILVTCFIGVVSQIKTENHNDNLLSAIPQYRSINNVDIELLDDCIKLSYIYRAYEYDDILESYYYNKYLRIIEYKYDDIKSFEFTENCIYVIKGVCIENSFEDLNTSRCVGTTPKEYTLEFADVYTDKNSLLSEVNKRRNEYV